MGRVKVEALNKPVIGKLLKKLVLESGDELIVIPAGTIIEVSSEDDYPHETTDKSMKAAARYLKKHSLT